MSRYVHRTNWRKITQLLRQLGLAAVLVVGLLSILATGGGGGGEAQTPAPVSAEPLVWDEGNWDEVEWQ